VELCLDGGIGSFVLVALSGLFLSFEHGRRQMLGLKSQGLVSPELEGGNGWMKVYAEVQERVWEELM
jgi:hypothetical protein